MIDQSSVSRDNSPQDEISQDKLRNIIEALLFASDKPLNVEQLREIISEDVQVDRKKIKDTLLVLQLDYSGKGIELAEVASGYRFQARADYSDWICRLWEEKPQKYSRALLETLALIAYRQPITRGDIEEIRGVAVSSNIMKTLIERNWVRVVGHREVPGRPAIYATTKQFLDYFNLASLDQLPPLAEIRDLDAISKEISTQLELDTTTDQAGSTQSSDSENEPNKEEISPTIQ